MEGRVRSLELLIPQLPLGGFREGNDAGAVRADLGQRASAQPVRSSVRLTGGCNQFLSQNKVAARPGRLWNRTLGQEMKSPHNGLRGLLGF